MTIFKYKAPDFGFESTWRYADPKKQNVYDRRRDTRPATKHLIADKKFCEDFYKIESWRASLDTDPYNIELKTKKLKYVDKKQFIKDYKALRELLATKGIVESSRSKRYWLEGGGHIHLDYIGNFGTVKEDDYPKNQDFKIARTMFSLFIRNLTIFLANNPWIAWSFNDAHDNDCMSPVINRVNVNSDFRIIEKEGINNWLLGSLIAKNHYSVLRPTYGSIEFRFFGMPKCPNEVLFHLLVANKIYKHVYDMTMNGTKLRFVYGADKLKNLTLNTCLINLVNVCNELKINWSKLVNFGKLVNLKRRFDIEEEYRTSDERSMLV